MRSVRLKNLKSGMAPIHGHSHVMGQFITQSPSSAVKVRERFLRYVRVLETHAFPTYIKDLTCVLIGSPRSTSDRRDEGRNFVQI